MSTKSLSEILLLAETGNYGVGAFNVSDLNQAVTVMEAAAEERSPVILQTIAGMHPYRDEHHWWKLLRALVDSYSDVVVALHLDHGRSISDCQRAIDTGFTSVMIDASRRLEDDAPASFEENISLTKAVVDIADKFGVSVEGELGTVGRAEQVGTNGSDDAEALVFASPEAAERFVAETGVDALAIAVGTSHGSVKFTTAQGAQRLRLDLIAQIKARLPRTYLVLHGSSSVPRELVDQINNFGGKLTPSFGVSPEQKRAAIAHGIRKINQGTDSHLAWTAAERRFRTLRPEVVDPGLLLKAGMSGMSEMIRQRMREFGSSGKA